MHRITLSLALAGLIAVLSTMGAQATNVVLFLGDGMGISTVTAARIFAGQALGKTGEEHQLTFDQFPHVALVKTYNTDAQVPDSAGTITAILTGRKTRMGVLGIGPQVERGDCAQALRAQLPSILQLAEQAGYATGIVSTTRITHATPAGTYAHSPDRNWESDVDMPEAARAEGCTDIAQQMIDMPHGDGLDVILGGGRVQFLPTDVSDPEYPQVQGRRTDGRNLIEAWLAARDGRTYVWNSAQFEALRPRAGSQFMGLFEPSHMKYDADRDKDTAGEPSIAAMTRFAIEQLRHNDQGFFLLVEGGRIDHGHHASNAYRALADTVAMDAAVGVATELLDLDNSLILVTADHSHTLTISGYPPRGNPILGKVPLYEQLRKADTKPYTTLSYANGPGYVATRPDLTGTDTTAPSYLQLGTVPLVSETHGGEDVAAFATGLHADKVRGVMEQNVLFEAMSSALFDQNPKE
ncbi:MAG: alkaline phosphatase [Pseudomonadota bacterium]